MERITRFELTGPGGAYAGRTGSRGPPPALFSSRRVKLGWWRDLCDLKGGLNWLGMFLYSLGRVGGESMGCGLVEAQIRRAR